VRGLIVALAAAALARMFLNTARRFTYPFAPSLARGLGVPLDHVTSLIAINQAASLASFLLGPFIDRVGPRAMMLAGMALLSAGMLAAGLIPVYAAVLIGLLLAGLGKASYDPALLAFVGQRVPFARRGLAIGSIELAWAGSSLVGIPVAGLLIDRLGWQAPFIALGVAALLAGAVLALVLPAPEPAPADRAAQPGARRAWSALARDPAARAGLAYALLFSMANDTLFVVYGAWLEQRFALTVLAVGTATTVIGAAEVVGEGLTATVADRIGLGRAALGGLVLTALGYLTLPLVGQTLPLALGALFVTFLAFEFTVVTALSLFTETLPGARATMMSALGASGSLGRVLGALIGGPVWAMGGLAATAIVSAALTSLALVCFAASLRAVRAAPRR
jgi:predicted MFS family arabinose efflux permease